MTATTVEDKSSPWMDAACWPCCKAKPQASMGRAKQFYYELSGCRAVFGGYFKLIKNIHRWAIASGICTTLKDPGEADDLAFATHPDPVTEMQADYAAYAKANRVPISLDDFDMVGGTALCDAALFAAETRAALPWILGFARWWLGLLL
ncbi:MAG: hypothetical protein IPO38_06190 [Rhodocyclaceae bacterium]|nr:hypothetical protein [Rhodocyclaceae bacterium]